jgi:hypothetical protein
VGGRELGPSRSAGGSDRIRGHHRRGHADDYGPRYSCGTVKPQLWRRCA